MKRRLQSLEVLSAGLLVLFAGSASADDPVVEAEIVQMLADHPSQGRAELIVDQKLSAIAQEKADDLLARGYFSHTSPEGIGPNFLVQRRGYWLPAGYSNNRDANNIESLARDNLVGPPTAEKAVDAWLASSFHRTHVLAANSFFAGQTRVGVGVASDPEAERNIYVFLASAPPAPRDVLAPQLIHSLAAAGAYRPAQVMSFSGHAFDPSDVAAVLHRISGMPALPAVFDRSTGQWRADITVPSVLYRRIRKGKLQLSIEVVAADAAGNDTAVTQDFKMFKKKKKKKKRKKRKRKRSRNRRR